MQSWKKYNEIIEWTAKKSDLKQHNFDYICDNATLVSQVGMTLQERAEMFMEKYPDKSMSRSRLQRLYKKYRINLKKIKLVKSMNYNARRRLKRNIINAKD